jgi:hypothetical protein
MKTETVPNEIWRPVSGYEGYYEVSNLGQVRSVARRIVHTNGHIQTFGVRTLKTMLHRDGYLYTRLCVGGVCRKFFVQRLVAGAFVPNRKGTPQVNHKNGIKADNRAENLEWVTAQENIAHAFAIGRRQPRPIKCLNTETVFPGMNAAAKALGLYTGNVAAVLRGDRKHTKGFRFERAK